MMTPSLRIGYAVLPAASADRQVRSAGGRERLLRSNTAQERDRGLLEPEPAPTPRGWTCGAERRSATARRSSGYEGDEVWSHSDRRTRPSTPGLERWKAPTMRPARRRS